MEAEEELGMGRKRDDGKLAEQQVNILWRMFGKHIYGAKNDEEFNRLKTLYVKHQELELRQKQMLQDFAAGRKVSFNKFKDNLQERSRSPNRDEKMVHYARGVQQRRGGQMNFDHNRGANYKIRGSMINSQNASPRQINQGINNINRRLSIIPRMDGPIINE